MAYNGSGTFTLVAGNPVVTGTTISSTWANNTLNDIATGLSTAITKDGQTTPTANIPMGGYKITGLAAATVNGDAVRYEQAASLVQAQTGVYFTTGGTTAAYTLTPTPALGSLIAGQRFNVVFNAANTTTTPTLAISGLTAKSLKVYDSAGAKADPAVGALALSMIADVVYDGTDYVVLDQLPTAINTARSGVRQTVQSGPVDSNGQSAFGGSTGSTTVTAAGTLVVSSANGFGSSGPVDRIGSTVNPSWTSLSTNGTMYLYLDVAADGTCTTGSGTLAPVYQKGGTYSTTSGQFTFNYSEYLATVGNGASAVQTYRVYVGQVTVAGNVVTAITWYALNRYFQSAQTAVPAVNTNTAFATNLGVSAGVKATLDFICLTTDLGYSVGDVYENVLTNYNNGTYTISFSPLSLNGPNSVRLTAANHAAGAGGAFFIPSVAATIGSSGVITVGSWRAIVTAVSDW